MKTFSGLSICIIMLVLSCSKGIQPLPAFFHGDVRHTGVYETVGVESLQGMLWRFKTGGRVFSSPVISGNMLFVGSDDGYLYALDASIGSLLWRYGTGGRVSSSAAVFNDRVYFVSFDGYLYCLDQESGKEIWKFKSAGERVFSAPGIHGIPEKDRPLDDPWDMFLSSPVVALGKVYFGCGVGMFYALDAATGQKIWDYTTGGVIHSSPAYADSTIFFGSWDSYLYAMGAADGSLKWKFKTGTDTVYYNQVGFQSSPVVYNGVVYSGCRDAHIWAIDATKGTLRWKYFNNGSWVIVTPVVHADTLYFTTSDTHKLIALQAVTGKELYTGDCKSFGFSSPALTEGRLYLGNFGGSLMAFETATGKVVWEFKTSAAAANKDSVLNRNGEFDFAKIFKDYSYLGNLKAMDVLYSVGSVLSSPAVANGVVYFGSTDSCVYALH
jgi:eukaryotic-like serine/threonine-protein kinase